MRLYALFVLLLILGLVRNALAENVRSPEGSTAKLECHELLKFTATKLRSSQQVDFCKEFSGKAMLVVNTASQCGFTPQFRSLEKLHQQYGRHLAIIGVPSDDFKQEYADDNKVAEVCYLNYGVTFMMLEPDHVTGSKANALFKVLAERTGAWPSWNFNKYLISADGTVVTHYKSSVKPDSALLKQDIEKVLLMKH